MVSKTCIMLTLYPHTPAKQTFHRSPAPFLSFMYVYETSLRIFNFIYSIVNSKFYGILIKKAHGNQHVKKKDEF